jgi:hypothetical protein
MRLDEFDPDGNARDLGRGGGGFGGGFGGGGGLGGGGLNILFSLLPMLFGRRMGCGGILLIAVIGFIVLNSGVFTAGSLPSQQGQVQSGGQSGAGGNQACDNEGELLACRVEVSTAQVWTRFFQEQGQQYRRPSLNFFTDGAQSGCGAAQSAMGPFYCPADQGIYIDVAFFNELTQRFGAAGDAAQAYVIAHEVGHHIQTLTGVSDQVRSAQRRASEAEGNGLQVRMELQADCYAGVWAATARTPSGQPVLEAGDIEEAMRAAHAIGDDTLMRGAGQRPIESMFTHGTSEQRMRWLRRGLETGDPRQCDTFRGAV